MGDTMRAAVHRRYGGPEVVAVETVPRPVPKSGQMLVRVEATTVSAADRRARSLDLPKGMGLLGRPMFGFLGPRQTILGGDFAGVVVTPADGEGGFAEGDRVFGQTGLAMGAHAEYLAVKAGGAVARMPDGLGFVDAAALPFSGTTALHFLRRAGLKPGETVLVIGASGAVGSALVQLARGQGAVVTAMTSAANAELVRGLGASEVIDYRVTPPERLDRRFDIVAETVGQLDAAGGRALLAPGGRFLPIAGGLGDILAGMRKPDGEGRRVISGPAPERAEDLAELARLAAAGILRPVIDRVVQLADIGEAHRRVDSGRKRGSLVLRMVSSE